jgi:predicted transcriptional regulator
VVKRESYSFRLPEDLIKKLDDLADRKRVSRAIVVETALSTFLSPDGADQLEGALARRLDRNSEKTEEVKELCVIIGQTLSLFIWTNYLHTPQLPGGPSEAAEIKADGLFNEFIRDVGRSLAEDDEPCVGMPKDTAV